MPFNLTTALAVGLGGFLGAISRFYISSGTFPYVFKAIGTKRSSKVH